LVTVCLIELVTDLGDNVTSHSTQPPPHPQWLDITSRVPAKGG